VWVSKEWRRLVGMMCARRGRKGPGREEEKRGLEE
jgi:hypothetical protein